MATTNAYVGTEACEAAAETAGAVVLKKTISLDDYNLVNGSVLRIMSIPAYSWIVSIKATVTTADSVTAGTVDVGTYQDSDDAAIDADGLINELAIGTTDTDIFQAPAASTAQPKVDAYVGLVHGAAGGGATYNDAVIDFAISYFPME